MSLTSQEIALRDLMLAVGLKRIKAMTIVDQSASLSHDFDVSAEDFLQQAEEDFELGGNNARLNALSNAKRAIHAKVDEVLVALGFKTKSSFPEKMSLLADLGFISPRILRRINDARNVLEHEYQAPTQGQVEEAIDLASLFLGATKRHMVQWPYNLNLGNEDERLSDESFANEIQLQFGYEEKTFYLAGYRGLTVIEVRPGFRVATRSLTA